MSESNDLKLVPIYLELCYKCPDCGAKRSMAINEYKYRRDDRDTMIDYCPDCGEIFEIVDTI